MSRDSQRILKRLRAWHSLDGRALPEEFVLPDYGGYGLVNVPATVMRHFGVAGVEAPGLAKELLGEEIEGARKLVVMLVDALGYLHLSGQMRGERVPGFSALARRGRFSPLTSVFPSTTAAALASFHTGLPPAGHGIAGYRMYLPERGLVANMIRLSPEGDERPNRLLRKAGDARALLGVPTVHRRLTQAGVRSYCLIHRTIYNSGLSMMLFDGAAEVLPFVNASDLFVQVRRLVTAEPEAPACIWPYWDAVDMIQHRYGTWGEEPAAEVRNFGYSLRCELLEPLRKARGLRAALMLLADHGQVDVRREDIHPVARSRTVREGLAAPPVGTGRTGYFYVRDGRRAAVRAALERALGARACVLESEAALASGLWGTGEAKAGFSGRVGDLLALMRGSHTLFYPYREGAKPGHLVGGRHGGLHEGEMLVPFFCARL